MTTIQLDSQVMFKKESSFGTPVTPDSALEYLTQNLKWQPNRVDAGGLRTGTRLKRTDRRGLVTELSGGDIENRLMTKYLGKLCEAALGTGTSNVITGAAYMQQFTLGDTLPSYTIQTGIPLQAGGAQQASTFAGMVATMLEIDQPAADYASFKTSWVGKSHTTATGLASASYPTGVEVLGHQHLSVTAGGTVTAPTTTTLATNGTPVTDIRSFNLQIDRALATDGHTFNGSSQIAVKPELGQPMLSGSFEANFAATTYRDAWVNDTTLPMVWTWTSPTQIGSTGSYPTFQIYLPAVKLEGDLPEPSTDGSPVRVSADFTVYDGLVAAQPIWISIVTLETAI